MSDLTSTCVIAATIILAGIVASQSEPLSHSTTQRDAPTVRFYDSRGNVTSSASTYGNTTRFFDARGNTIGRAYSNSRK
jgi:hypothetical protein